MKGLLSPVAVAATMAFSAAGAVAQQPLDMTRRSDLPASRLELRSIGDLLFTDVHNMQNQRLGAVDDVVVDLHVGQAAYILLESRGFLNFEPRTFVVPYGALMTDPETEAPLLDLPPEALQPSVGYEADRLPDLADRRWGAEVHSRFGVPPYWTTARPAHPDAGSGGWGPRGTYGRLYDPAKVRQLDGTVRGVSSLAPLLGMSPGLVLTLHTDEGDRLVHLGPQWFIERQDLDLSAGEEISVLVSEVRLDGGAIFIASEVARGPWTLRLREPDTGHPAWSGWRYERAIGASAADRPGADRLVRATELFDMTVRGTGGEPLAEIADLLVDRQGRVIYSMLRLDDDGEPVPVPWSALRTAGTKGAVELDVTRARLRAAPRLARRDLPSLVDEPMARRVHAYFNADPSRVVDSYQRWWGREQQVVDEGPLRRRVPMMLRYDLSAEQRWSGRIVDLAPEMPFGRLRGIEAFALETDDGETHLVCLGPSSFVAQKEIPLDLETLLEVLGAPTTIGERTVILAAQVMIGDETFALRDERGRPLWNSSWRRLEARER